MLGAWRFIKYEAKPKTFSLLEFMELEYIARYLSLNHQCIILLFQGIKLMYTSPFLRCVQTGHQVYNGLELSGMHTCNGLSEIISPEDGMHDGPPEVPSLGDIASCGIEILSIDHSDFAKWPETVDQAKVR